MENKLILFQTYLYLFFYIFFSIPFAILKTVIYYKFKLKISSDYWNIGDYFLEVMLAMFLLMVYFKVLEMMKAQNI